MMTPQQKSAFNSIVSYMDKLDPKEKQMQKTYVDGANPVIGDRVATAKGLVLGVVTGTTLSTIKILPFDYETEEYTDDVTAYRLVERAPIVRCGACKHESHSGKCSQLVERWRNSGIRGVKCCPCAGESTSDTF